MSKEGDFCSSCSGSAPKTTDNVKRRKRRLERIGTATTKNKGLPIIGCRRCDSPEIFDIAESNSRAKDN